MRIAPSPYPRCVARAYALAFAAATALAAQPVPLGEPFLVNQTATGSQREPRVGMSANGTFLVIWESEHDDAGDIRFRRFLSDGTAFSEGQMNQTATGAQIRPAIDMNPDGDYVVAWEDPPAFPPPNDGRRIRARRSAFGGATLGNEFAVHAEGPDDATEPAVSRDFVGAFVVSWQRDGELYLRGFDENGAPLAPEEPTGIQPDPNGTDAAIGHGQIVDLAFGRNVDDDVFRRPFTLAGAGFGDEEPLAGPGTAARLRPVLATGDGLVAAWEENAPDAIRARVFHPTSREPLGDPFDVASPGAVASQLPRLDADEDGAFVVTWQETTGGTVDVFAREFHRDGRPLGPPFVVNTVVDNAQFESDVAVGRKRFVVVWRSNQDTDEGDIHARVYLRRSIFADGFETGFSEFWSATVRGPLHEDGVVN